MKGKYNLPERRVCRAMKICRSIARYIPIKRDDEDEVTGEIIELSAQYGRYGYRRITALMRAKGRCINHKRVERIWRQAGLKVPQNSPRRKDCGSMTEAAFGFDRNIEIMYGVMTL